MIPGYKFNEGNSREVISRQAELKLLASIATNIGRNYDNLPLDEVTGFMAMQGRNYDGGLMVVGRAVNGWTKRKWTPEAFNSGINVQDFVDCVLKSVTASESCPMQWVSSAWSNSIVTFPSNWAYHNTQDYNSRKSAFWRVIRNVIGQLDLADIEDAAWPSCLVWSNLYKVSPAVGRNPSGKQRSLQRENCILLLEKEIQIYKPRRLLFLTGYDWAEPFLKHISPNILEVRNSRYVQAAGTFNSENDNVCRIVVAAHPERKLEAIWVQDVLQALQVHE